MRVCKSRKSMHSVMKNTGFGDVQERKGDIVITIPQNLIEQKNGHIKKKALKAINSLTIGDILIASEKGLEITIA